jgi:hypothetical protein
VNTAVKMLTDNLLRVSADLTILASAVARTHEESTDFYDHVRAKLQALSHTSSQQATPQRPHISTVADPIITAKISRRDSKLLPPDLAFRLWRQALIFVLRELVAESQYHSQTAVS